MATRTVRSITVALISFWDLIYDWWKGWFHKRFYFNDRWSVGSIGGFGSQNFDPWKQLYWETDPNWSIQQSMSSQHLFEHDFRLEWIQETIRIANRRFKIWWQPSLPMPKLQTISDCKSQITKMLGQHLNHFRRETRSWMTSI